MTQESKPSGEIILIPKQLRMDWNDVMASDPNIPLASYRVAGAISVHFGNKSGLTYVSQVKLAKVTRLGLRTVNRAIIDLEQRGYLLIQRRQIGVRSDGRKVFGGRGVANVYLPALGASQLSATDRGQRLVIAAKRAWEESENESSSKHAASDVLREPDKGPYSLTKHATGDVLCQSLSTPNASAKHATGDVPTLTSPSEKNSSRAREPSRPDGLGSAGAILRTRFGEDVYRSWFRQLAIVGQADSTVTLAAPTKFIASRVLRDFESPLLDAFRTAVSATVTKVEIIVREESAA